MFGRDSSGQLVVDLALDIETECAAGCEDECDHALDPHRNTVTVVGVYAPGTSRTFRDLDDLRGFIQPHHRLITHAGKFDLHSLATKGLDLSAHWAHDTLLMANTLTERVPDTFLWAYARRRAELNEALPRGKGRHRKGSPNSLKVLAPYWLGVEPFWEDPTNHDSDEYVLKDVRYTYELYQLFKEKLERAGSMKFYEDKFMPWARRLLAAEMRGIRLDTAALEAADAEAQRRMAEAKLKLDEIWAPAYEAYRARCAAEVTADYREKAERAIERLKSPAPEKAAATRVRYQAMADKAKAKIEPLNLDSPKQLTWLLRDHLGLDITDFDGNESTGKPVLKRLAPLNEGVKTFLEYRQQSKLVSAFFPSYRAMAVDGVMHTTFNPCKTPSAGDEESGTAKGRLSSSNPNLQQVPGHLHKLFIARPGYKLATFDMSAIEPRIIAYYTHDPVLYDLLAQGKDYHNYNTAIFFDLNPEEQYFKSRYKLEREVGKEVGLALKYGAGTMRIMESAQKRGFVWTRREAQYKLDKFREAYSGVFKFRDQVINPALREGPITTILGRPLYIEDPDDIHLKGMNQLVQVSASDLVQNSADRMMREFEARGVGAHVLLLVHDEIVTEVPVEREAECVELIKRAMTDYKLETPLGPIELKVEGKVSDCWEK